jgi:2-oxoglutarate ferredoxin oxidoreductase subunit alpha
MDVTIKVGGEAGQGVQTIGYVLAKACALGRLNVFAFQDYESRIRGGHNFYQVRVRDAPVAAGSEAVHILVALNRETIDLHQGQVVERGVVLFDPDKVKAESGPRFFGVPFERLAQEATGNRIMSNTVATGAALGMAGYDLSVLAGVLREHFGGAGREVAESNVKAASAGYEYARREFKGDFSYQLHPEAGPERMLISGNEATALGALGAGCKFVSSYPMTPTTSIMEFMAEKAGDFDLVVLQAEDEIAAMNMVIGASFAGVRAMAATSGGGFSLMVEGLGLAGMTETPIVIVEGQRGGPSTGLPTRTEQGDLEFVLYASQGEFPRIVLAPATIEDAFYMTARAFNLAERYQVPVIILSDQHLASSYATVDRFDHSRVTIERSLISGTEAASGGYERHRFTDSGISPRAIPGQRGALVVTAGDEHDEEGHITEDAELHTKMMLKRLRKLEGARQEMGQVRRYGPEGAEVTLLGWGSTYGALAEATDMLRAEGKAVNLLHLSELWPFPARAVAEALGRAKLSYVVEQNVTGQLAHLIRAETGRAVSGKLSKFDGRALLPGYIVGELKREVKGW